MQTLNDLDSQFVKCVGLLHSSEGLTQNDVIPLQQFLEDAIKHKSGQVKDLSAFVKTFLLPQALPARIEEFESVYTGYDESKGSNSDNELELDLLKADLMCVVCNLMDVGARNRLIECTGCQTLYHQECHRPAVSMDESFNNWMCQKCKDKKVVQAVTIVPQTFATSSPSPGSGSSNLTPPMTPTLVATSSSSQSKIYRSSGSSSSSHKHSSSSSYSKSLSSSKSSDKHKSSKSSSKLVLSTDSIVISSGGNGAGSSGNPSSPAPRNSVSPNLNIINADKRIQNMKKKAAKLQEKRKQR